VIELFCDRLERLVAIDSPSGGLAQERVAGLVLEWLAPLGASHTWIDEPDNPARSLAITLEGDGGPAVALIGHPDTVFGEGTAGARPFRRDGDRCFGPGVADMKGGLVLAAMAMERLAGAPSRSFGELRLLICADEEIRLRAPAGAGPARDIAAALVFECARENGDLVSVRKGAVWRTMTLHGRAAHAGADTARGRSAVSALAREILRIEALTEGRAEMTSVITTVSGGDSANTVPAHSRATIDIRSSDPADLEFAEAELDRPLPYDGITMAISDRGTWPPMPRADGLVDAALTAGGELGLTISEQLSGGVSDGCWTGEWGVPTIDGLGPVGGHDHTPDEWIEVATVPARIELTARVVLAACAAPSRPAAST
jgi:glutamate carboxypeptidase